MSDIKENSALHPIEDYVLSDIHTNWRKGQIESRGVDCPRVLLLRSPVGITFMGMPPQRGNGTPAPYRRRSARLPLEIPVHVYGRTPNNFPFRDQTCTLTIDAHGARVSLAADVEPGQSVLLVHSLTQEERECRVVHVGPKRNGRRKVGLEFRNPPEDFWHVFQPVVVAKPQASE